MPYRKTAFFVVLEKKWLGFGLGFCILLLSAATNPTETMTTTDDKLTATEARDFAKRIISETMFKNVKARKGWGGWEINIDGGRGACYGKTLTCVESAEETLRIFANA